MSHHRITHTVLPTPSNIYLHMKDLITGLNWLRNMPIFLTRARVYILAGASCATGLFYPLRKGPELEPEPLKSLRVWCNTAGSTSTAGQRDGTHPEMLSLLCVCLTFRNYTSKLWGASDLQDERNPHTIIKVISGTTLTMRKMLEEMGITAKYINSGSFSRHTELNHVDLDKEKYIVILQ